MGSHEIKVEWEGPFNAEEVIETKHDGGKDGKDYGLYQIYGKHILCGLDTLLYIGQASQQTFSRRFKQHQRKWLASEENIRIYLGRVYDPQKHSKADNWKSWEEDIDLAEKILIYKYSPNYNQRCLGSRPNLSRYETVCLIHRGGKHKLEEQDNAPNDYT
jgi:hypothetical protein